MIYLGQLNKETGLREGIGITVFSNGDTLELKYKVLQRDIGRMVNRTEKGDIQLMQTEIAHPIRYLSL